VLTFSRRSVLKKLAACSFGLAAGAASEPPPNVVLVMTDDQGYGDLACHGNRSIKTPNIDRLSSESVRLTNYHVSPTCAPTRAALLTGRYSNATGVWHTIMGRSLLHPEERTLADCFRAGGYRTGIFGKWHLGDNYPCRPQDRGFDEVLIHGGGGVWQTPDYFGNDYFDDVYNHNGKPEKFSGFCTDVWFQNAIKFITAQSRTKKPFFCYIATNAPHSPFWAPEISTAMYKNVEGLKQPEFFGMISNIDSNVGKLKSFLETSGLADNTIFIFTTDNGSASGSAVFNAGMRGAKGSPYEGGHRVPFFIRWPKGGLTGGRDISNLTAHIDILPTLMELCNLKRTGGRELHGTSLVPLLRGRSAPWPERTITVDSQRLENLVKWRQSAVMTQRWRLVNKVELYDIVNDPAQQKNVASAHPEEVRRLQTEYEKWWRRVSEGSEDYVRIVLGNRAAKTVQLNAHDWHGDGALLAWNQQGIRKGVVANGFWAVHVEKPGEFRFELRRWPKELNLPLNAPYTDPEFNRETQPGVAVSIVKARVKIGSFDLTQDVKSSDTVAVFSAKLPAGPAKLETWFYGKDGSERGAYYVTCTAVRA